jgi:hypothetical protein
MSKWKFTLTRLAISATAAVFVVAAPAWALDREGGGPTSGVGFDRMDRNGDGRITPAEWPGDRKQLLVLDTDRDGVVSREEFGMTPQPVRRAKERFRLADRNEDGRLSRNEWKGTRTAFASHDEDRDGALSFDEFLRAEAG